MKCPFCGGDHIFLSSIVIDEHEHYFYGCSKCQCEGPLGDDQLDALQKWTKRVPL